jgi:hypothetical protein
VRLRFNNGTSMSIFDVRIDGLPMTVVQADGNDVMPVTVDEFRISVAETYDVIVQPPADRAHTIFVQAEGIAPEIKFAADSLLEGDGFELPVPRELGLRRGRRLALHLDSLTLRRRGPDWNTTKRRRDSERRASTAAE